MKKVLSMFLSLAVAVSVFAEDQIFSAVNGNGKTLWYRVTEDYTCQLIESVGTTYDGDIVIPQTVEYNNATYTVTSLAERIFYQNSLVTSVTVPATITTIPYLAFAGTWNMESITLHDNITKIGSRAFNDSGIKEFTVPAKLSEIEGNPFYNCNNLKTFKGKFADTDGRALVQDNVLVSIAPFEIGAYTIPADVTKIKGGVFNGSYWLTSVTMSSSVKTIEKEAFSNCTNLASVSLCNVTYVGQSAFEGCKELSNLDLGSSLQIIAQTAFLYCESLSSITIPETVTEIGPGAFTRIPNLEEIKGKFATDDNKSLIIDGYLNAVAWKGMTEYVVPAGVKIIGFNLFSCSPTLEHITIPNSVRQIDGKALQFCDRLRSLELPEGLETIGEGVTYSSGVKSVVIPSTLKSIAMAGLTHNLVDYMVSYVANPNDLAIDNSNFEYYGGTVVVPAGSKELYEAHPMWEKFTIKEAIGEKETTIDGIVYTSDMTQTSYTVTRAANGFESLVIKDKIDDAKVTAIAENAFSGCSSLKSITITGNIRSISPNAFSSCANLESVKMYCMDPKLVTVSGDSFNASGCALYAFGDAIEDYRNAQVWQAFSSFSAIDETKTLIDGEAYDLDYDMNVTVKYKRTFTPGMWQPLYVPFSMTYEEWSDYATVAELACVHVYDDGKTIIEFVTVNGGEIRPNVPYVIKPIADGEVTFSCENKRLKAAPADGENYISCSSPRYVFKLFGNYQPISAEDLADFGESEFGGAYVMTEGNKFSHASDGSELKPYRFYITREKNPDGYWSAPPRNNVPMANSDVEEDVIYFMVDGQISGIFGVTADSKNDSNVYDLNGIETKNPHNGVFIMNGKKVFIK